MKQLVFIMTVITLLCGCQTIPKPTPSLFQGQAGWKAVSGTISDVKPQGGHHEIIVTRDVVFPRTGMLVEDAVFGRVFKSTIKAGTPVFAAVYGNRDIDMAWCTPGNKDGFNPTVIPQNKRSNCMFYDPQTGLVAVAPGHGSTFWANDFISPDANGSRLFGSVPNIEEGPVDFGMKFTIGLRITDVKKDKVQVSGTFSTNEDTFQRPYGGISLPFDSTGKAVWNAWGGLIELEKIDSKNVSVKVLRPFTESTYTGTWGNRLRTQDR